MSKKFPYESCFAGLTVKPMVAAEKDAYLSIASLDEVKSFLPNIDTDINIDLLPVAFNACVINRVNRNKDVIDTETAIGMCQHFIHKPINIEHNRQKVIGMILTAGFSEFGTDKILTKEQVSTISGPFNITLGGLLWRVVCPKLAEHVEESSDPTSDKYLSISASWELGFTDYRIVLLAGGEKNLSQAKQIISDPKEIEDMKKQLTSLGGVGKINDLFAYRMPSYDVLPLGIGFTEKPAAEVQGIASKQQEEIGIVIQDSFDEKNHKTVTNKTISIPRSIEKQEVGILNPAPFLDKPRKESLGEKKDKISQSDNFNVKIERTATMKITSLKDITEDTLKECTASAVSDFIATELTKGSSEWEKNKTALNTQLAEAKTESETLKLEHGKLQTKLQEVEATVKTLNSEKIERQKVESFNVRMASVNEEYDLDDEVRSALVEDIKVIESDEAFAKWQTKAKVLLKGFAKKKAPPFAKKCDDEEEEETEASKKAAVSEDEAAASKKAKASAATASVVANAIDNGDKPAGLPNGTSAADSSLKEKYKEAFAKENFVIKM